MNIRHVKEGILDQGEDERIVYKLTTTPWGSGPTAPTTVFVLYDTTEEAWTTVTATKTTGAITVSGDVITLPTVFGIVNGHRYRGEVLFVCGVQTFEAYFEIQGCR